MATPASATVLTAPEATHCTHPGCGIAGCACRRAFVGYLQLVSIQQSALVLQLAWVARIRVTAVELACYALRAAPARRLAGPVAAWRPACWAFVGG